MSEDKTPKHFNWKWRAEELRTKADDFRDNKAKRMMYDIADTYDMFEVQRENNRNTLRVIQQTAK